MAALGLLLVWGAHRLVPRWILRQIIPAYLALVAALIAVIVVGLS